MYLNEIPARFFSLLNSRHKEEYLEVLFAAEAVLSDAHAIALERAVLVAGMRQSLERRHVRVDVSDEEDFDEERSGDFVQDNLAYMLRAFIAAGWMDSDNGTDGVSETLFITLHGRKLLDFIRTLSQTEDQSSFVVNTYTNLSEMRQKPDIAYICVQNAYKSTQSLLVCIEMMYSKIKRYYSILLENTRPEELLDAHLGGYVKDVVDKVLFPLKVDDSVDRYRGPILELVEQISADHRLLNKAAAAAAYTKRVPDTAAGEQKLMEMLSEIRYIYIDIENYMQQLDDKNRAHIRQTSQKLTYMLSMDTSVKGNIIALLRDSKDRDEDYWDAVSSCVQLYDGTRVRDESFYKPRTRHVKPRLEELEIEEAPLLPQEEVDAVVDTYGSKFTGPKVSEYAAALLQGDRLVSASQMPVTDDDGYLMSIFLATNGFENGSTYEFDVQDGTVDKGCYTLPNFLLKRKEARK